MLIGLHDAEAEHFRTHNKFPNYALMKISAYHKARGDMVEWWYPLNQFDRVYSSKVFDFTPENPYLPPDTIKGGTGYGIYDELPLEIDNMFPDYSLYPSCDYAIGYITRGCIRNCPWCVVPKKEGRIKPYRRWRELVRPYSDELVLMDNNILAHPFGIGQLEELAKTGYKIDLNQGMDCRLVTPEIADILAQIKWIKYIRFSCDQKSQIEPLRRTVKLLTERGIFKSKLFIYCIITKDLQDDLERVYALRDIIGNSGTIYAQPEKNPRKGIMPEHWQNVFAQKYIYGGSFRKMDWDEYVKTHEFLHIYEGGST